jgi:hypothetical protein
MQLYFIILYTKHENAPVEKTGNNMNFAGIKVSN